MIYTEVTYLYNSKFTKTILTELRSESFSVQSDDL